MSMTNRVKMVAEKSFGSCEPPDSIVWNKLKARFKKYDERVVEDAFRAWAEKKSGLKKPVTAFLRADACRNCDECEAWEECKEKFEE
jgi:hypothetical protein